MKQNLKYGITGMTCGHCVQSVTEEVSALEGVSDVKIDLVDGGESRMTLTSEGGIDFAKVEAAVAEAGNYIATAR